ncbi:MAG: glutamine-hydrolyzing carbamoyl-phosphate synthase small subunit [Phycisphaerae bacterium]|nr:glutamine-hydrolyzing carbamoyl-phosphate synthase small subunit [Phycisphaerae bacterium]
MLSRICKLALEDGTIYTGRAFGADGTHDGEVCFNTSLTGYQEILTDPSYCGQIVTMTYPLIGNYGINEEDLESARPQSEGFVIKELARRHSNYRAVGSLEDYLKHFGIVAIEGVDTRAITCKLRTQGALRGSISTEELDDAKLVARAQAWPGLTGQDMTVRVAPDVPAKWNAELERKYNRPRPGCDRRFKVVAVDCGMKRNILRHLVMAGCQVTLVPGKTSAASILEHKPDGVFLSNGPGDPEPLHYIVETLRGVIGKAPIFGICLGHQLLSLALGAKTYKLKYGHRGGNQPVMNLATRRVEITSQNHGYAVDVDSLRKVGGTPTHMNLNDQTLEGFMHTDQPIFSVQYHPEASPGPHDATYLVDCFIDMMKSGKAPAAEEMAAAQARLEHQVPGSVS